MTLGNQEQRSFRLDLDREGQQRLETIRQKIRAQTTGDVIQRAIALFDFLVSIGPSIFEIHIRREGQSLEIVKGTDVFPDESQSALTPTLPQRPRPE